MMSPTILITVSVVLSLCQARTICDSTNTFCNNQTITDDIIDCSAANSCEGAQLNGYVICGESSCNFAQIGGDALCSGKSSCTSATISENARCSGQFACRHCQLLGCGECSGEESCSSSIIAATGNTFVTSFAICSGRSSCQASSALVIINGDALCSGEKSCISVGAAFVFGGSSSACCTCPDPGTECCSGNIFIAPVNQYNSDVDCPSNISSLVCPVGPTSNPTTDPTFDPTQSPSNNPSLNPTQSPSNNPSANPTLNPSTNPTFAPSNNPSLNPTQSPSNNPSITPSNNPSANPTLNPSANPSGNPTLAPSSNPSANPSLNPSMNPTLAPSNNPSTNPTLAPSNNPSANPSLHPSTSPTTTTMAPTPQPIDIGTPLNGTLGSASALTFNLNLLTNYESVTLSTCSANTNLFNLSLAVFDAAGAEVAVDAGSCPNDGRQAQIALTNAPAGNYTILLSQLGLGGDPNDLWSLSVVASTFSPTSSPTTPQSDSNSGSDSDDSGSDSDDASLFSAFSFANNDAANLESNGDGQEQYEMKMSLSSNTLMNMWLIVALCAVVNIFGFCMCRNKAN